MSTNWFHNREEVLKISDMPEDTFGFIYEITHIPSGKKYIGKKQLLFNRKQALGKKEIALITDRRRSKKKVVTKESDWKSYYGSHNEIRQLIQEGKEEDFLREIVRYVPNKKLLTYYETKELFSRGVLEPGSSYYNDNIEGRYYKKDFNQI